jgi:hypothetical protein
MKRNQKKWLKILAVIIVILVGLILSVNMVISYFIEKKVDAILAKNQPKNYSISYKRIGFNFFNKSINIIDLSFKPDTLFLDSLLKTGYKSSAFDVKIKKIAIIGICFKEIIKNKFVDIKKIKIKKPEIVVLTIPGKQKKIPEEVKKKTIALQDSIKIKGLNGVKIGFIEFLKSKFNFKNYKTGKEIIKNEKIDILIKNITLTKSNFNNDFLYPDVENASLTIDNNVIKLENNLYEISFNKFYINFKERFITVDDFRYKPLYSKKKFSKYLKFQKERYDVEIDKIRVNDIDFRRWIFDKELYIKNIHVSSGDIDIYRDKTLPFDHSKRPLLPNQALKKLKFQFFVDTVYVDKVDFVYEEITKKQKKPLHVEIGGINGTLTNITTINKELNKNDKLKIELKAKLMKKAPLIIKFEFPMLATNNVYYFTAETNSPFNLKILNPAIYPASGMKFSGGIVDELFLNGTAFPTFAHGRFKMLYHDLKLSALDKDGISQKKALSWGVNKLVSTSNPKKGKPPRETIMFFQRDMEKGFGNFLWKTVYSGLKGTIIPIFQNQTAKQFQKFVEKQKNESK